MATGVGNEYRAVPDEEVQLGTGKTWAEWVALLDAWEADTKTFVPLMNYLAGQHGLSEFWAQVVAVYYCWGQWVSTK